MARRPRQRRLVAAAAVLPAIPTTAAVSVGKEIVFFFVLFCGGELTKSQNYRLKATQRTRWRTAEITGAEGKSGEMKSRKKSPYN